MGDVAPPNASHRSIVSPKTQLPASTRLRQLLSSPSNLPLACPGVYDGLTARLAISAGFKTLYMTGAGTSMSRLGQPDLGLITLPEMAANAGMIAQLDPTVPLIADADTGYGAPASVGRTVQMYVNAGVAALHIEDQPVHKRCGHLKGKEIVEKAEYLARIRAAVSMRRNLGSDIVIIARTDALAIAGLDEALERLKAAVEVGADVAFLEAITDISEAKTVCDLFRPMGIPVMYGMVQGSHAPRLSLKEAREVGFSIVVYAGLCLGPVYRSCREALRRLQEKGDCEHFEKGQTEFVSPKEIFDVCGLGEWLDFDRQAAEDAEPVKTSM